ncbi:hypothetical protein [Staphylococcus intermedius]|uniref:Uncharacterized protein n=1 Tax=Staphylococcus intermedius NCTC 11048 TaxID=1141106 RepID=A0A380G8R4_STAIN|nr:hypothetical protein [Staphylococcus intermedius]PCF65510.1 hypothetical protein B5C04_05510 [Staphylococcus intermedius]PCF81187.1 hypothetical protein B4W74_05860 [Staphylococcus intermedius]PCF82470.1 hypothetical protein B4W70_05505 [Staphylococcus intermedius]PCF87170.1 hypothetical protein B4W75_08775 [Staphylococcus intermedius]PCF87729.1 hypothetical protein B4W76_04900 [Staphylococcus intermedius]
MNKTIKMMINVLPVFLVPLILERKKFKEHPDVQKVTQTTVNTSKTVAHQTGRVANSVKDTVVSGSSHLKSTIQTKKRRHDYNKVMKKEAEIQRYHRPENVRARGKAIAKENRKEIDKLAKNLEKHVAERHKEEDKALDQRQKQMIKTMKKMQKYEEKVGHTPGQLDAKTEKRAEKIEKRNKKEVDKMNKNLKKHLEQRHKKEEKAAKAREKALKKNMKDMKKYEEQAGHTPDATLTNSSVTSDKTVQSQYQQEKQRITTLSELQTTQSSTGENQPTTRKPGQVETTSDNAPLYEQHYQNMERQVQDSDTLRQNQQLNDTSQKSMKKQGR